MNVTIIEDDEQMAFAIASMLEPFAKNIWKAHSFQDGMRLIESKRSDVLMLDLMLPDSNEVNTLNSIRAIKAVDSKLAVVVITGVSHVTRNDAASFGADGFLHKRSRVWDDMLPEVLSAIHNTGRPDYGVFVELLTRISKK